MNTALKTIHSLDKNDKFIICKLLVCDEERTRLASLGIREGAVAEIFLKEKSKMILKLGSTKIALSDNICLNIFGKRCEDKSFKESLQNTRFFL